LPTAQRMYRFLDKRFYPRHQPPVVEMDLQDFACGHIGLSRVDNVAELKRRLTPAIEELEDVGFIARADIKGRYQKIRAGVWRIKLQAGPQFVTGSPERSIPEIKNEKGRRAGGVGPLMTTSDNASEPGVFTPRRPEQVAGADLAAAYYRTWNPQGSF